MLFVCEIFDRSAMKMKMKVEMISFVLFLARPIFLQAVDNGIGLTPPMGWRQWKAFYADINQVCD